MKKFYGILATLLLFLQGLSFANSINLFNDSIYTLRATIYDAEGTLLGEFVLNPRDATEWNDDQMNLGMEAQPFSLTPYSVNWTCMGGSPYGSCSNVSAGAVVTAQSCGGAQQCQQQQQAPPY